MIHSLKTAPKFFDAVEDGIKNFEVRKNDRDYKVGDVLELYKYPDANDTDFIKRRITYIITHEDFPEGVPAGYVVMGISKTE